MNRFGALALAASGLVAAVPAASAQPFPSKAIRVVAPFSAGGGADTVARSVAQKLS